MGNIDYAGPIGMYISPDPADPTRYVVNITQAGLGMPVRDYYLNEGAKFDAYRAAYKTYVTKIFELIGDASPGRERRRRRRARDGARHRALVARAPARRAGDQQSRRSRRPRGDDPGRRLGHLPARRAAWAACRISSSTRPRRCATAPRCSTRSPSTRGRSISRSISRATTRATCPKRSTTRTSTSIAGRSPASKCSAIAGSAACSSLDGLIGEGVGELYVAKFFPPDYKAKMDELVANLVAAMGQRLEDARVDGRRHARRGGEEARHVRSARRLSREMARLLGLHRRARQALRERAQRPQVRLEPPSRTARRARRPRRMGHEPADGQRLLQPARQPDHVPGRDPAAAVLRSVRRPGRELRRHRRRDRPRDRPRLRRPRPRVRRDGQDPQLVDARDQRQVHGRDRQDSRSSTTRSARSKAPA